MQVHTVAGALCDEIDARPDAGLLLDVIGPGGCGKTSLIEAAAAHYAEAGVAVVRDPLARGDLAAAVVLVDDAHLLNEASLDRLRDLARSDGQRLVVAHRRWPASPALTALGAVLTARRPPVVLGHLDRQATAERVRELLGASCPEPLIRLLHEQTAGLPVLLEQLVAGLRDTGQLRDLAPGARLDVPPGVREQLRYVIDALPDEVRQVLLGATIGAGGDTETLARLLNIDAAALDEAVKAAQASGFMTDDGAVVPLAGRLLLRLTPAAHVNPICETLARLHLSQGGSALSVGRALLRAGARGPNVAAVLLAAGNEALGTAPELAGELLADAAAAGARAPALLVSRADAAARSGRLNEALRLADEALNDEHGTERVRALGVIAAVFAHRGLLPGAAELYRMAGAIDGGGYPAVAVPVLAGVGALGEARQPGWHAGNAPTLRRGAEALVADGVAESISGSPVTALSQLTRAATLLESAGSAPLLPDTPAALAALVAMHAGEFAAATSTLRRAISAKLGGRPYAARHRLLMAFLASMRGYAKDAHALLRAVSGDRSPLEPRDELFAAAVAVGLARREGDLSALQRGWTRAREALMLHPVDLYVLLPLGELAVAAARLGEQWWIEPHLRQADALLARLGQPVLWRVPLHWYRVHAAIAGESPQEARRHVTALAEAASVGPYACVLAGAAACWIQMLAGAADVESVAATARQLGAAGLGAEGARLAGQAAIRTTDRKAMTMLLECARMLRPEPPSGSAGPTPEPSGEVAPPTAPDAPSSAALSLREQEIACQILAGLTYKEIGAQLFISPKTVEHHVARIRRRLGATSRRELFGQLQAILGPD